MGLLRRNLADAGIGDADARVSRPRPARAARPREYELRPLPFDPAQFSPFATFGLDLRPFWTPGMKHLSFTIPPKQVMDSTLAIATGTATFSYAAP